MVGQRNNWTREEHILAFNLYCKIPFTKINANYEPVKELAQILGRTQGSVAMKLANFARLDPVQKARNVSGLSQGAKGEEEVWNEFHGNWEDLAYESERILADRKGIPFSEEDDFGDYVPKEGEDREVTVKQRVNQGFFRKTILSAYDNKCCITGLSVSELLIASHIIPWSKNKELRTDPTNGLCLNALHDRAFDKGLITITPDYEIRLSDRIISELKGTVETSLFLPYHKQKINSPNKFLPSRECLEYHNFVVFKP